MFVCVSASYLHGVQCHEHSEAAQMFTFTHSVCGIGVLFIAAICGPGPFLIPVCTDVAHLLGLLCVLCIKQYQNVKSRL